MYRMRETHTAPRTPDDVDVTPEMIAAGTRMAEAYGVRPETPFVSMRDAVEEIFRAMASAMPKEA